MFWGRGYGVINRENIEVFFKEMMFEIWKIGVNEVNRLEKSILDRE